MAKPNQIDSNNRLILDVADAGGGSQKIYVVPTGAPDETISSRVATLWQSRSYQQALDELGDTARAGWEAIVHGWEVAFRNGVSAFGKLAALNRNIPQAGEQGPTPTDGRNGTALRLAQGLPIIGKGDQILGWKSNTSSNAFTPNPADLVDPNTNYVYADAFFSWEEDSANIVSDITTGTGLTTRNPANTVNISVETP